MQWFLNSSLLPPPPPKKKKKKKKNFFFNKTINGFLNLPPFPPPPPKKNNNKKQHTHIHTIYIYKCLLSANVSNNLLISKATWDSRLQDVADMYISLLL